MENIFKFIIDLFIDNCLIISVGTFITGAIIKQSITFIDNDFIPLLY